MANNTLNKVQLIGNLGAAPELSAMANSNRPVAKISLATTTSWYDKVSGSSHEQTEWHRVIFFDNLANTVHQYLAKGSKVFVEGRIHYRAFKRQDGSEGKVTEIVGETIKFLDPPPPTSASDYRRASDPG